jgi:hypothetical protein
LSQSMAIYQSTPSGKWNSTVSNNPQGLPDHLYFSMLS